MLSGTVAGKFGRPLPIDSEAQKGRVLMVNTWSRVMLSALLVVAWSDIADAKKLPKNAAPMTADEVKALYAGNSAVWENSKAFFSPDGKTKGVFGKGKKRVAYAGEWSVADNEVCMKNSPKGEAKVYTDCWKWWRVGDKTITLWSVHFDGSKVDEKTGYYDEMRSIKRGDKVSAEFAEIGGI
jgi:hypothetical protein